MAEMAICFPWLDPQLSSTDLPSGVVFFDPGMQLKTQAPRWSPEDLPLSPDQVRAYVRSYWEFGQRFPKVSDLQAYQAQGLEDFYTDSSMDIRAQLLGAVDEQPNFEDLQRQGQLVLALALMHQGQMVALGQEKERLQQAQASFSQALGLDADDPEPLLSEESLPWESWPVLLSSLLRLLPPGLPLFVDDQAIVQELLSMDLSFTSKMFAAEELLCTTLDARALTLLGVESCAADQFLVLLARPLNNL